MKRILAYMGAALVLVGLLQPVTHIPETPAVHAESAKTVVLTDDKKQESNITSETPIQAVTETVPPQVQEKTVETRDNETIAWDFFISNGFTREQAAGILGNLRQEHNFNTSDVPGGLGIAQWMGNRRANLMARDNYLDINVQLQYLLDELQGSEMTAYKALQASPDVETSVYSFSRHFERCGDCRNATRVLYAYEILGRH